MKQVAAIQILRGVAALGVVAFHARLELTWRGLQSPVPDMQVGAAGVDLFFAISGFVMVYAAQPLFGSAGAVGPFLLKRALRVVPLYWFYTLVRVAYIFVANRHSSLLDDLGRHLFVSLSFLPSDPGTLPILPQGWSLTYEMAFYLGFALCLPFAQGKALFGLACGILALVGLRTAGVLGGKAAAIADPQILEFLFGIGVARLYLKGLRIGPVAAAALAAVASVALVATVTGGRDIGAWRCLAWGLPTAAILAAFTLGGGAMRRAAHPLLLRLGDASYSIYLTHFLVYTMLSRIALWIAFRGPAGTAVYFVLLVGAAVAAGFASYRWIERPLLDRLGRAFRPRAAGPAAARRREPPDAAGSPTRP